MLSMLERKFGPGPGPFYDSGLDGNINNNEQKLNFLFFIPIKMSKSKILFSKNSLRTKIRLEGKFA